MKKTVLCLMLLAGLVSLQTACQTPPTQRVTAVTTLEVVGASAKSSLDAGAQLLAQGKITVAQWQTVATFYDTKWQPAYALAVAAVNSDLSSTASPDLIALAGQLALTVSQLTSTSH